jgi:hypothetical protein
MRSLSLCALALLLNACVSVPNTAVCTVPGLMSDGMICAETNTGKTSEMTLDDTVTFLEPETEPSPRAGAMCMTANDWNRMKTALEQACRMLGNKCTYEGKPKK